jgi:hypothetical protein
LREVDFEGIFLWILGRRMSEENGSGKPCTILRRGNEKILVR